MDESDIRTPERAGQAGGRDLLRGDRLAPKQTIESVEEDARWASGQVSSVTDRMRSATDHAAPHR